MTARAITRTWIAGVAFVAVALIPIPYLAAPRWQVWVVDDSGAPLEGMTIRLVYQNSSAEAEGHEENRSSDVRVYVAFPSGCCCAASHCWVRWISRGSTS